MTFICAECTLPIDPERFNSVVSDLAFHIDTGEPHHWSCLQECYERERLADEREQESADASARE
jgi:hypothetical protein